MFLRLHCSLSGSPARRGTMCVCVCVCACLCAYVWVHREREREREREGEKEHIHVHLHIEDSFPGSIGLLLHNNVHIYG